MTLVDGHGIPLAVDLHSASPAEVTLIEPLLQKHCKQCDDCGAWVFYPRSRCSHCLSDRLAWREVSGRGTVYTYSAMERANPPYVIAYVQLEEGPKMMTNIVDCAPKDVKIGMAVKVKWVQTEDGGPKMPFFAPA